MANAIFPKFKQAMMDDSSNIDLNDGTVKVALIDLGTYTYSAAHEFYSDISASVISTPQTITNTTVTDGTFDGDNVTFPAVTVGDTGEALIWYIDTGVAGTSRLAAYQDTGVTGLPVTTNGGDITIQFDATGHWTL